LASSTTSPGHALCKSCSFVTSSPPASTRASEVRRTRERPGERVCHLASACGWCSGARRALGVRSCMNLTWDRSLPPLESAPTMPRAERSRSPRGFCDFLERPKRPRACFARQWIVPLCQGVRNEQPNRKAGDQ
jgi:hypothetical protein